jgi:TMEM175 potassium channel family protein
MNKNRLEAFSDGVLAIIITVMVLEMKRPDRPDFSALLSIWPVLLSYVLSFVYVGIYWNNHHHMFHATKRVNGAILWANLHLLFWISLFPFATAWMGENHVRTAPTATYGVVLFMAGTAYYILQTAIIADEGPDSVLARAIGRDWKGKLSPIIYISAIVLAFVSSWIAIALYTVVAIMWLIPDRRIERALSPTH